MIHRPSTSRARSFPSGSSPKAGGGHGQAGGASHLLTRFTAADLAIFDFRDFAHAPADFTPWVAAMVSARFSAASSRHSREPNIGLGAMIAMNSEACDGLSF